MTSLDRPVSEIMEREVATLQQGDLLDLADDIMQLGRIRHLPVLEGERLVGILSSRDLLAASLSKALDFDPKERRTFLRSVEVKEVMTQEVETIAPGETAHEAGKRMLQRRIGCLPVVDDRDAFVGLVTETDLLKAVLGVAHSSGSVAVDADSSSAGRYAEQLEELRRVRDELRVQVHLGKAEAAELWEKLEHRFSEAEGHARALAQRAEEPLHDVAEAARHLIDEIRGGYRRLRKLL